MVEERERNKGKEIRGEEVKIEGRRKRERKKERGEE